MSIRVHIADDQSLARTGFRLVLDPTRTIDVVVEARSRRAAAQGERPDPDVVLMDVGCRAGRDRGHPRLTGGRAPASWCSRRFDNDEYVYEALRPGASGFLLKDAPPADSPRQSASSPPARRCFRRRTRRLIEAFTTRLGPTRRVTGGRNR